MYRIKILLNCFFCLVIITTTFAFSDDVTHSPLKIGNFSLRKSQQPGPLVGVGGNIVDKEQTLLYLYADINVGNKNYNSELIPGILYGITDNCSIFFNFPFSPGNKVQRNHSWGWDDIFVQMEYAFYAKKESNGTYQATLLGNITIPTGSTHKDPATGYGSPNITLGATFNHTTYDWFYFGALEGIYTTSYHGTQFGNQFLYEAGIGRTFCTPPGWLIAWMLEFNGNYSARNRLHGNIERDSGGNTIFITPSIWISSEKVVFQLGLGPIFEQLNGHQPKQYYSIDFNFGYSF